MQLINERLDMAVEVANYPSERELTRSEEEEKLLRNIREEKERLWMDISVSHACCVQLLTIGAQYVCIIIIYISAGTAKTNH